MSSIENGWLIERGQLCLGGSSCGPQWVTFTDPKAIRFSREQDASAMLISLQVFAKETRAFLDCTVSEHSWKETAEQFEATYKIEVVELEDKVETLTQALRHYSVHDIGCIWFGSTKYCNCGLDALINPDAALQPQVTKEKEE